MDKSTERTLWRLHRGLIERTLWKLYRVARAGNPLVKSQIAYAVGRGSIPDIFTGWIENIPAVKTDEIADVLKKYICDETVSDFRRRARKGARVPTRNRKQ